MYATKAVGGTLSLQPRRGASRLAAAAWIGLLAFGPTLATAATTHTVVDVPTRGVTQRFLHVRPDKPVANVVSIPGGDGILGLQNDGTMTAIPAVCGPFIRTRDAFAARGFGVALVDQASDGSTYRYEDILEVVRYLRARDQVPTWIVGGSASTRSVVRVATDLPLAEPLGLIVFSPISVAAAQAALVKRPALVMYHASDFSVDAAIFAALTAVPVKERVVFTGGNNAGCGYHLFNGLDAEVVDVTADFINRYNPMLDAEPAAANYQGLWWAAPAGIESGWGINFAHQGDVIFATWYTYDAAGRALWLTMTAERTAANTYQGTLYQTRGPVFSSVPFNPAAVTIAPVGSGTLTFADEGNGTFAYTASGLTQSKPITRQVFGPLPVCTWGAQADLGTATNYQDLWWAAPGGVESGWGVNFTHQGDIIFATWFTYDNDGTPLWLSATANKTAPGAYSGTIYRTTGPAFSAVPFRPTDVTVTPVGTLTLSFQNGNAGTFAYTIGTVSQSKAITRQVFRAPGTVCR